MEDHKGTDLNTFIRSDSSDASDQLVGTLKKIPSLPQLKPHFIVKEYCGRPRRESQTLYLEERVNRSGDDDLDEHEKQNNKPSRGITERIALIGGAFVGGAIGLYMYGSSGD